MTKMGVTTHRFGHKDFAGAPGVKGVGRDFVGAYFSPAGHPHPRSFSAPICRLATSRISASSAQGMPRADSAAATGAFVF